MFLEPATCPGSWVFLGLTLETPSGLSACSHSFSHHILLDVSVLLWNLRGWKLSQASSSNTHFTSISIPLPHPESRNRCSLSSDPQNCLKLNHLLPNVPSPGASTGVPASWRLPGASNFLPSPPLALEILLIFLCLLFLMSWSRPSMCKEPKLFKPFLYQRLQKYFFEYTVPVH